MNRNGKKCIKLIEIYENLKMKNGNTIRSTNNGNQKIISYCKTWLLIYNNKNKKTATGR